MRKRDELSDPNSCLNKAADDEPVFVLRAHDASAPDAIRAWVDSVEFHDYHLRGMTPVPPLLRAKLDDAEQCAQAMEAWPNRKYPD